MCGIAGFYDSTLDSSSANSLIADMLECISYRGPDASVSRKYDALMLGHNRLSIIDLKETANQPMEFDDAVIIFNGEVYNYIELKKDLIAAGHRFHTDSDTEVILAAYRKYGRNCVQKFVGMWAFVIWDKTNQELFCSRDRFGIKPFYYIAEGNRFYFGSEYKSLKKSPLFHNQLNLDQVSRGLQMGWLGYQDETYFTKIRQLPEASNLLFKNGRVSVERYWNLDPAVRISISEEEKTEKFRAMFLDSIRLHMRADVEVGGCLSGGLDSSSIASAVSRLYPQAKFKTYTIYYEGKGEVDERPWVQEVLKSYPTLEDYTFSPTDDDIREHFPKVINHADVPIAGSSPVSQYFLMRLASRHKIKVLLDGQGSDEYLAGYMHSFYRLLGGLFMNFQFGKGLKEFNALAELQGYGASKKADVFAKSMLSGMNSEQQLYELEYKRYFPFLSGNNRINFKLNGVGGSRLNRFLYHLTFTTSLPSLLHYEDRNSMAFSIESRVPFLDHRLVEFVFSLPDDDKISGGITKNILRRSLHGIVPEPILNRMDKKGFVTPGEVKWLRGPLKFLLDDVNFSKLDFMNKDLANKIITDFKKGENKNANLVWRIVVLNFWLKQNA